MTGPEHYREAERLIASSYRDGELSPEALIAEAQVHATLALAAATALNDNEPGLPACEWKTWREVAGTPDLPEVTS